MLHHFAIAVYASDNNCLSAIVSAGVCVRHWACVLAYSGDRQHDGDEVSTQLCSFEQTSTYMHAHSYAHRATIQRTHWKMYTLKLNRLSLITDISLNGKSESTLSFVLAYKPPNDTGEKPTTNINISGVCVCMCVANCLMNFVVFFLFFFASDVDIVVV